MVFEKINVSKAAEEFWAGYAQRKANSFIEEHLDYIHHLEYIVNNKLREVERDLRWASDAEKTLLEGTKQGLEYVRDEMLLQLPTLYYIPTEINPLLFKEFSLGEK